MIGRHIGRMLPVFLAAGLLLLCLSPAWSGNAILQAQEAEARAATAKAAADKDAADKAAEEKDAADKAAEEKEAAARAAAAMKAAIFRVGEAAARLAAPRVQAAPAAEQPASKPDDPAAKKVKSESDADDPPPPKRVVKPLPPRFIRLHLMDGTVIAGDLSVDEITVATEFGKLTVPISRISSLTPGLDSHPEMFGQIKALIETLGGEDYKAREEAHKELLTIGPKIHSLLAAHKDDENAERKRHIEQILKELDELAEDKDELEEGAQSDQEWAHLDTVVTPKFTILGKVSPASFTISSKYGPLTIKLNDVRMAQREQQVLREAISRKITVPGINLVQRSYKSSGVRVERGDSITISADGQIVMTPWGSNSISGPDGGQNYGWFVQNEIPGGALVARIGNNDPPFKVGSRYSFVAKKPGILHFAIAMQHEHAQNNSFPGQYNVRVKVEPQ